MSILLNILGIAFTSALAENAFFARCFITELTDSTLNHREDLSAKRWIYTIMAILAAASGWLGRFLFTGLFKLPVYLSTPLSCLIYIAVFMLIYSILRYVPACHIFPNDFLDSHVSICFGFLPVGVLLLTCLGAYNWYESLIFGLGSAIGYLLAMQGYIIFADRLKYSKIPFFLRGLPIRMIGIGLISLGFYGLLGHTLAA